MVVGVKRSVLLGSIASVLVVVGCSTQVTEKHFFSRPSSNGENNYYRVKIEASSDWFDNVRFIAGDFDEDVVNEYFAGPITRKSELLTMHKDGKTSKVEKDETKADAETPETSTTRERREDASNAPAKPKEPAKNDDSSAFPRRVGRPGTVFLYIQSARANVIANEIKEIATARVLGDQLAAILNKDRILDRATSDDRADDWQSKAASLAATLDAAKDSLPADEDAVLNQARELLHEMGEMAVFTSMAEYRQWLNDNRFRLMNGETP